VERPPRLRARRDVARISDGGELGQRGLRAREASGAVYRSSRRPTRRAQRRPSEDGAGGEPRATGSP
jgi:hypothetical protein